MRVSYEHANVHSGNESTLLRFTTADDTRACILVDAGDDVDIDSMLAENEYLNAILCTHAHIDHYRTLATNVRHSAPIYTTPATAKILKEALPEAQKDNDLGEISVALNALEPIDEWTSILHDLEIRPLAAGHTPGAAGFIIRFRDENAADGPLSGEQHLLVTGDFTVRPCAGFPGLATSYPFEIDCLFMNASSESSYSTALNESLQAVLERAYAGSRVVVATSSLTGIHYATLLGTCTTELDRDLSITVTGQAAKLYDALEYDVPNVAVQTVFDHPETVLTDGGVTIVGPETPSTDSSRRVLSAIDDDPDAVFVQLTTGDSGPLSHVSCTTHTYTLCNHPSLETIDGLVRELAPKELVIKHARGNKLNEFQRRYDHCFVWGTDDEDIHRLYGDGQWQSPDWIADTTVTQIRTEQWQAAQEQSLDPNAALPVNRSPSVSLEAESVDFDSIKSAFAQPAPDPYALPASTDETSADDAEATDGQQTDYSTDEESFEEELRRRLEAIETKLESSEKTFSARVLNDGDGGQFLQLLDRADFEAGDIVEITIETTRDQQR